MMLPAGIGKIGTSTDAYGDYEIRHWPAAPDLRWAVEGITLLSLKPAAELHRARIWRLLPDESAHLLVHAVDSGGQVSIRCRLAGPRSTYADIDRRGRRHSLILRFRPAAAGWFVPDIGCLVDSSTDFGRLDGCASELEPARRSALNRRWEECIERISQRLRRCCRPGWRRGVVAGQAIRQLQRSRGRLSVGQLQQCTGYSDRYLRQVVGEASGLRPKRLARILRLRSAVRLSGARPAAGWADIATQTGYYDQSHLIAEFESLAGESPDSLRSRLQKE